MFDASYKWVICFIWIICVTKLLFCSYNFIIKKVMINEDKVGHSFFLWDKLNWCKISFRWHIFSAIHSKKDELDMLFSRMGFRSNTNLPNISGHMKHEVWTVTFKELHAKSDKWKLCQEWRCLDVHLKSKMKIGMCEELYL